MVHLSYRSNQIIGYHCHGKLCPSYKIPSSFSKKLIVLPLHCLHVSPGNVSRSVLSSEDSGVKATAGLSKRFSLYAETAEIYRDNASAFARDFQPLCSVSNYLANFNTPCYALRAISLEF
jgi:hypothetical protein